MGPFSFAKKNAGAKTKNSRQPKKKNSRASSEHTTSTAYEKDSTKKKSAEHRRHRRDNDGGSKEQPSTAVSSKIHKEKAKSKNQKKKKLDADAADVELQKQLRALNVATPPEAILHTPPGPHNHHPVPPAHGKKSREEEPRSHKPPKDDTTSMKGRGSKMHSVRSPAPVVDSSLKIHSTVTPNSTLSTTDKWVGEDAAKSWLDKVDFGKTKAEFERLQMMTVNVETECKRWKSNGGLNQSTDDYPALDSNLITFENVYVNMSLIQVPLQQNIYSGQIPVKGNEEAFWKVIFDKRVTFIEIITDQESIEFFPNRCGSHVYHGTMFVNNRRVETASEDVHRFLIEVLPEGCSNSIICNISVIKNWNFESVYSKQAVVIKETIELMNFLTTAKDESAMVLSKHGAGRAGYFIALSVAVFQLNKAEEPSLYEIVKALRAQRPKSVESLTQYASLYTSLFYYIKKKMAKVDVHKKVIPNPSCPITKKVIQLTSVFTNALLAEVCAAAGRSTLTVIK
ncbi:unnamed protein product [Caenorhabditis nigoni]